MRTESARCCDNFRLYASGPALSVRPCSSIFSFGYFFRSAATESRTVRDSGFSFAELYSNVTPSSVIEPLRVQPYASTATPGGVSGHLSTLSSTPSLS